MQNKFLQKWLTIIFTAFVTVFLFGGTGLTTQTAYADTANPTTEELCKGLNPSGTYLGANGSCFIPAGINCATLNVNPLNVKNVKYEPVGDPDEKGTVCQKKVDVNNKDPEKEKALKSQIYFLIGFEQFLNTVIWPVLVMTGDLMNNNILFGAGMDERLREIWIPIRNLINLFFVLAMVAIAIYNILGIGDDNDTYSIKQILPKMIIAIIAVNFSFMGIKVFLDGINLLTTSIFALPDQVKDGLGNISQDEEMVTRFCLGTTNQTVDSKLEMQGGLLSTDLNPSSLKVVVLTFAEKNQTLLVGTDNEAKAKMLVALREKLKTNITPAEIMTLYPKIFDGNGINAVKEAITEAKASRVCTNDAKLTPRGKAFLIKYNSQNAAFAMALNMSKIVFYPEIDLTTLTEANISKLFINTIFSVAMYLIYVASFIALFVVLLARLVVLWLGVVASPVIIVAMVLPVFKEKLGFGELIDKFVQNAIAPILIAGAMTVGWIMLRAIQNVNVLSSGIPNITNGIPVAGLNTIQDLMVAVGAIAILWMAVFAAASKSIAAPVTDKIKGFLGSAGSYVGSLATKRMPLFPVTIPGKDDKDEKINVTPEMLDQLSFDLGSKRQTKDANKLSEVFGLVPKGSKNFDAITEAKDSKEAISIMRENEYAIRNGDEERIDKYLKKYMKDINPNFIEDLKKDIEGTKLAGLIGELFEKGATEEDKKKIRVQIADRVKGQNGEDIEKELDNAAAATAKRTTPTPKPPTTPATPAPKLPNVTPDSSIGAGIVGANGVKAITDATNELTAALKSNKNIKDVERILQKFKVGNNNATVTQLKEFINDPAVSAKLKALFGEDDAKIKAAIDESTTAAADKPQAATPGVTPSTSIASAAPQPPNKPNEQSPENPNPPSATA